MLAARCSRSARWLSTAGSAYILSLIALLILTILGLSLSLVTQSEMQVGANERLMQRVFYTAESGIALSTSWVLTVAGDCHPTGWRFVLDRTTLPGGKNLGELVQVSPAMPLSQGCCNFCPCQENPDAKTATRWVYGLASTSQRLLWDGSSVAADEIPPDAVPVAQKVLGTMIEVQPFQASEGEANKCLDLGAAKFAQLKF